MEKNDRVSNIQLQALIITSNIGAGILALPSSVANAMDNAGWIGIVLGGLAILPFVYIMNKLAEMYRGKIFYDYGKDIVGNTVFKIFSLIYLGYFLIVIALVVRIFGEVIKVFLLENTPLEVIMFTMLLTTSYIARSSIEGISRMALVILPILAITTLVFVLVSLPTLDFTNLLPIARVSLKDIYHGTKIVFFSYIGFEIILIALAYIEDSGKALKSSFLGIFYTTLIYLISFFVTLSQFGIHELKKQIWPSLSIMREIDLPGFFIENIDGLLMAAWVLAVFTTMGPMMYTGGVILSSLFNTKKHDFFVLAIVPIIYAIATIPESLTEIYTNMDLIVRYLSIFTLALGPMILLIVSLLKRGEKT